MLSGRTNQYKHERAKRKVNCVSKEKPSHKVETAEKNKINVQETDKKVSPVTKITAYFTTSFLFFTIIVALAILLHRGGICFSK